MLDELRSDLRFGLRLMRRSPGFTAVALVTMALAIGANTAVFSLVNGVLIKPFPFPDVDRIVDLRECNLPRGWSVFSIAPANFLDWQARSSSFERMALYRRGQVTLTGGARPEVVRTQWVGDGYLEILGRTPARGRCFAPEEYLAGSGRVAIVGHAFWQRAMGGRTSAAGSTLTLDGESHTVVGVLPEGWRPPFGDVPEVIVPLCPQARWSTARGEHYLRGVARLKPGVSVAQAQADLSAIAAALAREHPDTNDGWGAVVRPLKSLIGSGVRTQLLLLLTAVGLVLLIACANVANMILARSSARSRELAIRAALGAGRGRVLRQLLMESTLLAVLGGAIGAWLAWWALRILKLGWPSLLPRMDNVALDVPVLLFTAAVTLGSGLLCGLLPAFGVGGGSLGNALRHGSRSVAGHRGRRRLRGSLVVVEVALAMVLLVGAGLLIRSLVALQAEAPGFEAHDRLLLALSLPDARYPTRQSRTVFADGLLGRLRALPGVESAAVSTLVPVSGGDEINTMYLEARGDSRPGQEAALIHYRTSDGFFKTMGIPLIAGRDISPADRDGSPRVAVVSEAFARQHFGGGSPIGARIQDGLSGPWLEIVGVVGEVQHYNVGEASLPQYYTPFSQGPWDLMSVVAKTAVPPHTLVDAVRAEVAAIDPDLPLTGIRPMTEMVSESISLPRFRTVLMATFGTIALLLAVVGLYGVLSHSVTQRSREIGIRVALGARQSSVLGLVMREGAVLLAIGTSLGLVASLALARLLGSLLFAVEPRDPTTLLLAPALMIAVALATMLVPARRAARLDPVRTLAEE